MSFLSVFLTREEEEDPRRQLVRVAQLGEVELSNAHGHGVLERAHEVAELEQVVLHHEEEEGAERREHDGELDHERAQALELMHEMKEKGEIMKKEGKELSRKIKSNLTWKQSLMVAPICMKAFWKLSSLLNLMVEVKTVMARRYS